MSANDPKRPSMWVATHVVLRPLITPMRRNFRRESRTCLGSHYAKPVSKWVTAECDRRTRTTFKFLLAFGAAVQYLRYDPFKIFDEEVDVNGSPVPFISTRVVRIFRWLGAGRLLHQ